VYVQTHAFFSRREYEQSEEREKEEKKALFRFKKKCAKIHKDAFEIKSYKHTKKRENRQTDRQTSKERKKEKKKGCYSSRK
jgi:hypothetical protein